VSGAVPGREPLASARTGALPKTTERAGARPSQGSTAAAAPRGPAVLARAGGAPPSGRRPSRRSPRRRRGRRRRSAWRPPRGRGGCNAAPAARARGGLGCEIWVVEGGEGLARGATSRCHIQPLFKQQSPRAPVSSVGSVPACCAPAPCRTRPGLPGAPAAPEGQRGRPPPWQRAGGQAQQAGGMCTSARLQNKRCAPKSPVASRLGFPSCRLTAGPARRAASGPAVAPQAKGGPAGGWPSRVPNPAGQSTKPAPPTSRAPRRRSSPRTRRGRPRAQTRGCRPCSSARRHAAPGAGRAGVWGRSGRVARAASAGRAAARVSRRAGRAAR
jgi:hypothetical protein